MAAWGLTLASSSVVPGTRWMVFAAAIGLMGVWPAVRLSLASRGPGSTSRPWAAARNAASDWLAMVILLQMVIWPLWLAGGKWTLVGGPQVFATRWSAAQTGAISATLVSWSAVTAWLVAWGGVRGTRGAATLAMAGCLLLMIGGPVIHAMMTATGVGPVVEARGFGPVATLWALTQAKADVVVARYLPGIAATALAALVGWIGLIVVSRLLRRPAPSSVTPAAARP